MIFAVQWQATLEPVPSISQLYAYHTMSYGKNSPFISEEAKKGFGKGGNNSENYFQITVFNALVKFFPKGVKKLLENFKHKDQT